MGKGETLQLELPVSVDEASQPSWARVLENLARRRGWDRVRLERWVSLLYDKSLERLDTDEGERFCRLLERLPPWGIRRTTSPG